MAEEHKDLENLNRLANAKQVMPNSRLYTSDDYLVIIKLTFNKGYFIVDAWSFVNQFFIANYSMNHGDDEQYYRFHEVVSYDLLPKF